MDVNPSSALKSRKKNCLTFHCMRGKTRSSRFGSIRLCKLWLGIFEHPLFPVELDLGLDKRATRVENGSQHYD